MTDIGATLQRLRNAGLHRRMRQVDSAQGAHVMLEGKRVMLLCSNDYLGLANHPSVRRAAANALEKWGAGAGASRLVSGNMAVHRRLEERIASFKQAEAAVLFGSGYLANNGVIPALAGRGETVFSDELNHASLIDGCRLAQADTFVYRHRDMDHLVWGIRKAKRPALIVSDGVFSMDGDVAPLHDLVEIKEDYGCRLMIDDAHGTGTLGPEGRGSVAEAGLSGEVDVVVGTLGKALGSYGAFACASREIIELLVNTARPLIFSTGLPPSVAAAADAAIAVLACQPERVEALERNAAMLRDALTAEGFRVTSDTHIIPVIVGEAADALALCERLLSRGLYAQAIRPPTVPDGTSRLRLTVMATHRPRELEAAARAIGSGAREIGILGARPDSGPEGRLLTRTNPRRRAASTFADWDAGEVAAAPELVWDRAEHDRSEEREAVTARAGGARDLPRGAAEPNDETGELLVPRLRPRMRAA